ncbi:hypothetical protein MZO42_13530 [Sphingomonas psychrotolerans]|uniref:Right handed beta helix domain-containing protein n=1 Tax=Sphingomonas psychrotolerans TaxID=1327635 RepID=A0ABU3N5A6_9SPHN|nr:hypothetical protein [Sphingomonas psychrotolerans]MDT8759720.1 hypothetical protein [Sphingomonas psychrotolerans]
MTRPIPTRRMLIPLLAALPVAVGSKGLYALVAKPRRGTAETRSVQLAAFGGGPTVADNSGAMRAALAALTARGGGVLEIGAGTHRFASSALRNAGVALPSGVTVRGAGRTATRLQVTGTTSCNLFVAPDRNRIAIEDLAIIGNNVASDGTSDGSGAAIRWILTPAATGDMTDFAVRRVHLENFRGPYWLDVQNVGDGKRRFEMRAIALEDISFTSRAGNAINPGDVRFNSAAVCVNGSGGPVRDVAVSGLAGDARHIKTGLILYQQIIGARLERLRIANAGREGASDDAGAYAIQIYDSLYRMRSIALSDPVVTDPRSVGIYVAGATDVAIVNAVVSGQTDRRADTLPKGAIVFNGTRRWHLDGAELRGNWRDLDIVTPTERADGSGPNGRVENVTASGSQNGVSLFRSVGLGASGTAFANCSWHSRAQTVLLKGGQRPAAQQRVAMAEPDEAILFEDCRLQADNGFRALEIGSDPGLAGTAITLRRCTLSGSNPLYAKGHLAPLTVDDCTVRDLGTTNGAAAATLIDCRKLDVRNSRFQSPGRDGIGLNLSGSAGSLHGLQFPGTSRPLSSPGAGLRLGSFAPRRAAQA